MHASLGFCNIGWRPLTVAHLKPRDQMTSPHGFADIPGLRSCGDAGGTGNAPCDLPSAGSLAVGAGPGPVLGCRVRFDLRGPGGMWRWRTTGPSA
jgi:hypothetical protein